ncbi:delta-60 repeat domain-containing protein [Pseudomonas sp. YuFO20]|uniref:delta-60 repeat domain-containing protein n=1 Tax=Pseudomonas sp. YuFO20 TaxID=3095362 RepID=UPI002B24FF60|nr:delta-60 repeat domain-containing protein [Pseudomonas sp. YuFO20]MEB2515343.1 delta-60 repeat domain-containing protein [Pseudomonas sp. YuFO20]
MTAARGAGDLDESFDKDGKAFPLVSNNTFGYANDVLVSDNSKLFIPGRLLNDYSIVSLNTDGSMNTEFNNTGVVQSVFKNGFFSEARHIAMTSSNQILISGFYHETDVLSHHAFAMYRQDGTINTDFGIAGKVVIPTTPQLRKPQFPAIKSTPCADGGILVCSTQSLPNGESIGMFYRLHKNGRIDHQFGDGNGFVYIRHPEHQTSINSIRVQPDGKLLVAGTLYVIDKSVCYVARCNIDGKIDITFGENGFFLAPVMGIVDQILDINLSMDGRIAAVGSSIVSGTQHGLLLCLTNDGCVDPEFNDGAPLLTKLDENNIGVNFRNVAYQGKDKIIVHGNSLGGEEADVLLARYLTSGKPDQTFGSGEGWVRTKLTDSVDEGRGMFIQKDGRIVVCGAASIDGTFMGFRQFAARYLN